jgi:deleted in liver cancer protein
MDLRVVETLSTQADIVQYAIHFMAPQPSRDFCELRCWREASYLNQKYAHVIYSSSIENENIQLIGDVRANTLRNFYLIEINASNEKKCKLHQLYRADYRGYSTEWYSKVQAHLLKRNLVNLKECLLIQK